MKREDFRHFFSDEVRWGDCDMLGHVNNATYLRYIESARIAYISDLMNLTLTSDSDTGWIFADLHCSFLGQLLYPCQMEIGSRITRFGNSSATIVAAVFEQGKQTPAFTSTAVIVWYHYKQQKSMRVPDSIRKAVGIYEGKVEGIDGGRMLTARKLMQTHKPDEAV